MAILFLWLCHMSRVSRLGAFPWDGVCQCCSDPNVRDLTPDPTPVSAEGMLVLANE